MATEAGADIQLEVHGPSTRRSTTVKVPRDLPLRVLAPYLASVVGMDEFSDLAAGGASLDPARTIRQAGLESVTILRWGTGSASWLAADDPRAWWPPTQPGPRGASDIEAAPAQEEQTPPHTPDDRPERAAPRRRRMILRTAAVAVVAGMIGAGLTLIVTRPGSSDYRAAQEVALNAVSASVTNMFLGEAGDDVYLAEVGPGRAASGNTSVEQVGSATSGRIRYFWYVVTSPDADTFGTIVGTFPAPHGGEIANDSAQVVDLPFEQGGVVPAGLARSMNGLEAPGPTPAAVDQWVDSEQGPAVSPSSQQGVVSGSKRLPGGETAYRVTFTITAGRAGMVAPRNGQLVGEATYDIVVAGGQVVAAAATGFEGR